MKTFWKNLNPKLKAILSVVGVFVAGGFLVWIVTTHILLFFAIIGILALITFLYGMYNIFLEAYTDGL